MINECKKSDWRQVMIAQYTIFGTVAGLEITAMTIFGSVSFEKLTIRMAYIFLLVCALLVIEMSLIVLLINFEREIAWLDYNKEELTESQKMRLWYYKKHEKIFRWILIIVMILTGFLILSLIGFYFFNNTFINYCYF